MPAVFQDGPSGIAQVESPKLEDLSPVEQAQRKLQILEEEQAMKQAQLAASDRFDDETKALLLQDGGKALELKPMQEQPEARPLTVAEMLGAEHDKEPEVESEIFSPTAPPETEREPDVVESVSSPTATEQPVSVTETHTEPVVETVTTVSSTVTEEVDESEHYEVDDDDFFADDDEDEEDDNNQVGTDTEGEGEAEATVTVVPDTEESTEAEEPVAEELNEVEAKIQEKLAKHRPASITGEDIKSSQFLSKEEKTPKFIIIGATKCSTSALLRNV